MTLDDVLALSLQNYDVALTLKEALRSPLVVADPFKRQLGEFVGDFIEEYGDLPKHGDYVEWIDSLDGKRKQGVSQALQHLRDINVSDLTPEFVADRAIKVLRKQAAKTAVHNLSTMDEVELEDIQTFTEAVQAIEPVSLDGLADLRDVDKWARPVTAETGIPSGIESLDTQTGGFQKGELVFVLADSGVGKSAALINHGYAAALSGYSVLHITLELSQRASALRFYRRITESTKKDFNEHNQLIRDGARHWWRFVQGNYHLMYNDPFSMTTENLEQIIQLYQRKHDGPDMVIIDYLDLMAPSDSDARMSPYDQLGKVSHRVRGLGNKYDFLVMSATQATRPKGEEHEFLSLSKMGDSYKKVRAADLVIGFVRTREEIENNQGRYQILKIRESGGRGRDIALYVNMDLMLITDLDNPDVSRIKREHE